MRFWSLILSMLISATATAQLSADFSASATQGCASFTVQFNDNSTGGVTSWFWDFGNGETSALQNPSVTYTTGGKFTVRLIIKNASGQTYNEKANYITVFSTPDTKFSVTGPDSGCVALSTSFSDISDLTGITLASRLWNFGDGGTSSQQTPSYVYNAAGSYDVSLTLTTTQGCSSTITFPAAVIAGTKPVAKFSASPLTGCASEIREFTNESGSITSSEWFFGDDSRSKDENPLHHYLDTGFLTVKLIVYNNGCADSVKIDSFMQVSGPVALYNKAVDCANKETIKYRDESIDEKSRIWYFEPNQTSTTKITTHTFTKGIYTTKLVAYGTGVCNDTAFDIVHIDTGDPVISAIPAKDLYCRRDSILFVATGYDDVTTKAFAWNFRDGFSTDFGRNLDTINYVYQQNGSIKPELYLRDNDNCIDTVRFDDLININGPTADFKNDKRGCATSVENFMDVSASGKDAPINTWLWGFGDGNVATAKGPVSNIYLFPGVYNANLTVTDVNNCTDTITHTIEIATLPIVDAGIDSFACAGSSIVLTPSGAANYSWQTSADLSCTTCENPVATPQQPATYFVTGTTDGCSATDSVHITVQEKELLTVTPATYAICSGGNSVMLNASGVDDYLWSPSTTLSSTIVSNPIAFPSTNTTYTVTGKDARNCFSDMATVDVIVNEKPLVSIADSAVEVMTGTEYTIPGIVSGNVQTYQWAPPTGLSCTNCLQPTLTVFNDRKYTLIGTNQYGCTDTASISIFAVCKGDAVFIPNTFSPNNDGMNDYFYPRSAGSLLIKSLVIFNRWGQVVFQKYNLSSNNAANGWDGKYKNKVQNTDVYMYVMELQCGKNKAFVKKGNVSLIR